MSSAIAKCLLMHNSPCAPRQKYTGGLRVSKVHPYAPMGMLGPPDRPRTVRVPPHAHSPRRRMLCRRAWSPVRP